VILFPVPKLTYRLESRSTTVLTLAVSKKLGTKLASQRVLKTELPC